MKAKRLAILTIIGLGLIGLGLGLIGSTPHFDTGVYQAYGETATSQQLISAGLLAIPHFGSVSQEASPSSPFTSHSIATQG